MRPLWALVIYIVAVFIGGALLAPWLYWLVQVFAHTFPHIAAAPFHRFLDRSLLILALAGLWPVLRTLGITCCREAGLVHPRGQFKLFLGGLLLGFIMLAFIAGMAIASGNRVFIQTTTVYKIITLIFSAIGTAMVVAVIEEILFRGGLFGGLRKFLNWPVALFTSSVIYALAHFLHHVEFAGTVTWNSGLVLLPQMLNGFTDFYAFVPVFFNLVLAGMLLGLAYQRTGNLYFSIGLHAGWIFWLKTYSALTATALHAATGFWGTGKMIDGWLAFILLAVVLAVFKFLPFKKKSEPFTIP